MIKRTNLSDEEKRAVALKHSKKVKRYKILFVVSLLIIIITVSSFDKLNDMTIQTGIYSGSGLMLLSLLNLSVRNHCPFCNLKMDNRIGQRSPLDMNFPAECPFCGERLNYDYYEKYR